MDKLVDIAGYLQEREYLLSNMPVTFQLFKTFHAYAIDLWQALITRRKYKLYFIEQK